MIHVKFSNKENFITALMLHGSDTIDVGRYPEERINDYKTELTQFVHRTESSTEAQINSNIKKNITKVHFTDADSLSFYQAKMMQPDITRDYFDPSEFFQLSLIRHLIDTNNNVKGTRFIVRHSQRPNELISFSLIYSANDPSKWMITVVDDILGANPTYHFFLDKNLSQLFLYQDIKLTHLDPRECLGEIKKEVEDSQLETILEKLFSPEGKISFNDTEQKLSDYREIRIQYKKLLKDLNSKATALNMPDLSDVLNHINNYSILYNDTETLKKDNVVNAFKTFSSLLHDKFNTGIFQNWQQQKNDLPQKLKQQLDDFLKEFYSSTLASIKINAEQNLIGFSRFADAEPTLIIGIYQSMLAYRSYCNKINSSESEVLYEPLLLIQTEAQKQLYYLTNTINTQPKTFTDPKTKSWQADQAHHLSVLTQSLDLIKEILNGKNESIPKLNELAKKNQTGPLKKFALACLNLIGICLKSIGNFLNADRLKINGSKYQDEYSFFKSKDELLKQAKLVGNGQRNRISSPNDQDKEDSQGTDPSLDSSFTV